MNASTSGLGGVVIGAQRARSEQGQAGLAAMSVVIVIKNMTNNACDMYPHDMKRNVVRVIRFPYFSPSTVRVCIARASSIHFLPLAIEAGVIDMAQAR